MNKKFKILSTNITLEARLVEKVPDAYLVEFSWQPSHFSFAEIIEQAGDTPLPPYIKRKPSETDRERYQTIYAKFDGSVAAPTAGLHFTPEILASVAAKKINCGFVTLHVGAGTFKPVKANRMQEHQMHAEWMDVAPTTIEELIENINNGVVAVGTTSLRTLESLYWMGVKTILHPSQKMQELMIHQWDVYEQPLTGLAVSPAIALAALLKWLKINNYERLIAQTQILIAPGYQFRVVNAIITNFHQPQSTLLLLVAAAIGEDWRKVYTYAMENDFRFLSYGDGSLLFLKGHQTDL